MTHSPSRAVSPGQVRIAVLALSAVLVFDGLWVLIAGPGTSGVSPERTFPPFLSILILAPLVLATLVLYARWRAAPLSNVLTVWRVEWIAVAYCIGNLVGYLIDGIGSFGGGPADPQAWFVPAALFGATLSVFSAVRTPVFGRPVPWVGTLLVGLPVVVGVLVYAPAAGGNGSAALVGVALLASAFLLEAGSVTLRQSASDRVPAVLLPRTTDAILGRPPGTFDGRPGARSESTYVREGTPLPGRMDPPPPPPEVPSRPTPSAVALLGFERALLTWQSDLESQRQDLTDRERRLAERARTVAGREVEISRKEATAVPPPPMLTPNFPATLASPRVDAGPPRPPPQTIPISVTPSVPRLAPTPEVPPRPIPQPVPSPPRIAPPPSPARPNLSILPPDAPRSAPPAPVRLVPPRNVPAPMPEPVPPRARPAAGPAIVSPSSPRKAPENLTAALFRGLSPGTTVAMLADAPGTSRAMVTSFLLEGLRQGDQAIVVTLDRPVEEITNNLARQEPRWGEYQKAGKVAWVDGAPPVRAEMSPRPPGSSGSSDSPSYVGMLRRFLACLRATDAQDEVRLRIGVLGIAAALDRPDHRVGSAFLRNVVALLRGRNAFALMDLELGRPAHSSIEPITSRTDRTVRVRIDGDRSYVRVIGPDGPAAEEWVEVVVRSSAGLTDPVVLGR